MPSVTAWVLDIQPDTFSTPLRNHRDIKFNHHSLLT